jgi:XTP/dITP diphosphohydrolase
LSVEPFVLATANPDKAREVTEVLVERLDAPLVAYAIEVDDATVGFVVSAPDRLAAAIDALPALKHPPDVEETGDTLEQNARIKASAVAGALGVPAVADDTGLEIDALGGAPGVRSARFAGSDASYADNVAKVLAGLDGVPPDRRTARFATVALAWWPDGREIVTRGEVEGTITESPRGGGGFGYDPVFAPAEGDGRTFAEMEPSEKHEISHRGRAFRALAVELARTMER